MADKLPPKSRITDDKTTGRIIRSLKLGATMTIAAKAGGIARSTLHDWIARGQAPDGHPTYRKFYEDVQQAECAGAERALASVVKAAAAGQWQAGAWLLERRHGYVKREGAQAATPDDASGTADRVKRGRAALKRVGLK